jgi:hypothetical protein
MSDPLHCDACDKVIAVDAASLTCNICHDADTRWCSEECRASVGWVRHEPDCNVAKIFRVPEAFAGAAERNDSVAAIGKVLAAVPYAWQNLATEHDWKTQEKAFPGYISLVCDERTQIQTRLPGIAGPNARNNAETSPAVKAHSFMLSINDKPLGGGTFSAPDAMVSEFSSNPAAQSLAASRGPRNGGHTYWVGGKALAGGGAASGIQLASGMVNTFVLGRGTEKRTVSAYLHPRAQQQFAQQVYARLGHGLRQFVDAQYRKKAQEPGSVASFYAVNPETGDTVVFTVDKELRLADLEFYAARNPAPLPLASKTFTLVPQEDDASHVQALIMALEDRLEQGVGDADDIHDHIEVLHDHLVSLKKKGAAGAGSTSTPIQGDIAKLVQIRATLEDASTLLRSTAALIGEESTRSILEKLGNLRPENAEKFKENMIDILKGVYKNLKKSREQKSKADKAIHGRRGIKTWGKAVRRKWEKHQLDRSSKQLDAYSAAFNRKIAEYEAIYKASPNCEKPTDPKTPYQILLYLRDLVDRIAAEGDPEEMQDGAVEEINRRIELKPSPLVGKSASTPIGAFFTDTVKDLAGNDTEVRWYPLLDLDLTEREKGVIQQLGFDQKQPGPRAYTKKELTDLGLRDKDIFFLNKGQYTRTNDKGVSYTKAQRDRRSRNQMQGEWQKQPEPPVTRRKMLISEMEAAIDNQMREKHGPGWFVEPNADIIEDYAALATAGESSVDNIAEYNRMTEKTIDAMNRTIQLQREEAEEEAREAAKEAAQKQADADALKRRAEEAQRAAAQEKDDRAAQEWAREAAAAAERARKEAEEARRDAAEAARNANNVNKATGSGGQSFARRAASAVAGYTKDALYNLFVDFGEGLSGAAGVDPDNAQTKKQYADQLHEQAKQAGVKLEPAQERSAFDALWEGIFGKGEDPEDAAVDAADAVEAVSVARRALGKDPLGYPRARDPTSPYGRRNYYYGGGGAEDDAAYGEEEEYHAFYGSGATDEELLAAAFPEDIAASIHFDPMTTEAEFSHYPAEVAALRAAIIAVNASQALIGADPRYQQWSDEKARLTKQIKVLQKRRRELTMLMLKHKGASLVRRAGRAIRRRGAKMQEKSAAEADEIVRKADAGGRVAARRSTTLTAGDGLKEFMTSLKRQGVDYDHPKRGDRERFKRVAMEVEQHVEPSERTEYRRMIENSRALHESVQFMQPHHPSGAQGKFSARDRHRQLVEFFENSNAPRTAENFDSAARMAEIRVVPSELPEYRRLVATERERLTQTPATNVVEEDEQQQEEEGPAAPARDDTDDGDGDGPLPVPPGCPPCGDSKYGEDDDFYGSVDELDNETFIACAFPDHVAENAAFDPMTTPATLSYHPTELEEFRKALVEFNASQALIGADPRYQQWSAERKRLTAQIRDLQKKRRALTIAMMKHKGGSLVRRFGRAVQKRGAKWQQSSATKADQVLQSRPRALVTDPELNPDYVDQGYGLSEATDDMYGYATEDEIPHELVLAEAFPQHVVEHAEFDPMTTPAVLSYHPEEVEALRACISHVASGLIGADTEGYKRLKEMRKGLRKRSRAYHRGKRQAGRARFSQWWARKKQERARRKEARGQAMEERGKEREQSGMTQMDEATAGLDNLYGGADDEPIGCHMRGRSRHRHYDERDDYFGVGVNVGYGSDSDSDDDYHREHQYYGRSRSRSRSHSRTPGHSSDDEAGMM